MTTEQTLLSYLDQQPDQGMIRLDRNVFTDSEIFDLEMKYIFEANWIYLAHEDQISQPNDFLTTYMGRQPVIVNRNADGQIGAFINACAHRGAMLTNLSRGNLPEFSCPFHGWCYDSSGRLMAISQPRGAGYPDDFEKSKMGLQPIAKIESYRGFIFGSLSGDVPSLIEHLGESARIIDLLVDQTTGKLEVLRGIQTYTFNGNWKLQTENGVDGYHVGTIHKNYVQTVGRRRETLGDADPVKAPDVGAMDGLPGGYYALGHGHTLLWNEWPNPAVRPLFRRKEEIEARVGEVKARWMTSYLRNLQLYPNVFLMDQMSTQIRVIRPLAVDATEITTVCIAPAEEAPDARALRIRQYEDFFNASGMATPDDLAAFNCSQKGYNGRLARWNDLSRGAKNLLPRGADPSAKELGVDPDFSGSKLEDEGIFIAQHERWAQLMVDGLRKEME